MRRALLLAFLLLTTLTPALAREETPTHRGLMHYYTLAGQAAAADDTLGALQYLLRGLNEIPSSPHLRLGVARTYMDLGNRKACLRSLQDLARTGARLDLAAYPPLAPVATDPDFAEVGTALSPTEPEPAAISATLGDAQLWTEGIAWDPRTGDLLAGSVKLAKLVRVHNGQVQDLGTSAQDTLLEIIGLDVDPVRPWVWAVMGRDRAEEGAPHDFGEAPRDNGIVAYDLQTGARMVDHRRSAVADTTIHMWNDVSVAADGTAYFTDMAANLIWRLPPEGRPEVFHTCTLVDHINGLAVSSDGARLYVAGLEDILILDLETGTARLLEHGPDLCCGLGDGMALRDRHLFLVQNNGLLGHRILHLLLRPDGLGVEKSEYLYPGLPAGLMAYTCALGDGVLHVNGTAPFADYDKPDTPPMPVIVEWPYAWD